jgi:hypothetical protein
MKTFTLSVVISLFLILAIHTLPNFNFQTVNAEEIGTDTFLPIVIKNAFFTTINFDDRDVPSLFINTTALREEYSSLGVHFSGIQPLNGGGILNEFGNFGVTGYSPPNFLAFNQTSHYSDGGIPKPPQIITFDDSVSSVSFNTGSFFEGEILTLSAYDAHDHKIAETSISLLKTLQAITVTSTGIQYVIIDSAATHFVMDDLSWYAE